MSDLAANFGASVKESVSAEASPSPRTDGFASEAAAPGAQGAAKGGKDSTNTATLAEARARLERALLRLETVVGEDGAQRGDGADREALAALRLRLEDLTRENDRLQNTHRLLAERLDTTIARIQRLLQG